MTDSERIVLKEVFGGEADFMLGFEGKFKDQNLLDSISLTDYGSNSIVATNHKKNNNDINLMSSQDLITHEVGV